MKKRFTDGQIIAMVKEQEAGEKTADVCWRHGISSATFYKYKSVNAGAKLRHAPERKYISWDYHRFVHRPALRSALI